VKRKPFRPSRLWLQLWPRRLAGKAPNGGRIPPLGSTLRPEEKAYEKGIVLSVKREAKSRRMNNLCSLYHLGRTV